MDRTVSVKFYRVRRKDREGIKFSDSIRELAHRALTDREYEIDEDMFVRLERFDEAGGILSGEFVRRQVSNLPPKAAEGQPLEPLNLPHGYGLGHEVAFRYDPALSIIAIQDNRRALSLTRAGIYLSIALDIDGYYFDPVINLDMWQELEAARAKKLEIKVAAPDQLDAVENHEVSTKESLRRLKEVVQGANIEVSFSMGYETGFLSHSVQNIAEWILRHKNEDRAGIKKLKITGIDEDGETVILDLLKAHLGEKAIVNLPDDPEHSYARRDNYIRTAFRRNREALRQQFGRPQ